MAQSIFADHVRYVRGFDPHEKLISNSFERVDGTTFTKSILPLAAREEWFLRDHPQGAIDRSRVEKDWQQGIVTAYACLVPDIRCPEVRYPVEEATVSLSVFERDFPGKPHADLMGIAVNAAKSKAAGVALKKAGYRLDEETEIDDGEETAAEIEKADISAIESRKSSPASGAEAGQPEKKPTRAEKKAAEAVKKQENIRKMTAAIGGRTEKPAAEDEKVSENAGISEAQAVSPEQGSRGTAPQGPDKASTKTAEEAEKTAQEPSEAPKEAKPGKPAEKPGKAAQEPSGASEGAKPDKSSGKAEKTAQEPSEAPNETKPGKSVRKAENAAQEPAEALKRAKPGKPAEKAERALQEPSGAAKTPESGNEPGPAAESVSKPAQAAQDDDSLEARYRAMVCAIDGRTLGDLLETESSQKYLLWAATRHSNDEVREGAVWLVRKYSDDAHPNLRSNAAQKGLLD